MTAGTLAWTWTNGRWTLARSWDDGADVLAIVRETDAGEWLAVAGPDDLTTAHATLDAAQDAAEDRLRRAESP